MRQRGRLAGGSSPGGTSNRPAVQEAGRRLPSRQEAAVQEAGRQADIQAGKEAGPPAEPAQGHTTGFPEFFQGQNPGIQCGLHFPEHLLQIPCLTFSWILHTYHAALPVF